MGDRLFYVYIYVGLFTYMQPLLLPSKAPLPKK
jgi:hypothetical protein